MEGLPLCVPYGNGLRGSQLAADGALLSGEAPNIWPMRGSMLYGTPASSDDPESVVLRGHDRTEPTLSAKLHLDGRDGRGDVAVHLLASDAAVEQISAEATLSLPVWAEQYDLGELAVISRPESRAAEEAERREEAVDHAFAAFSRAS